LTIFAISKDNRDIGDPQMATMNISLPDAMKNWVERQTQRGRYGNASDYMRDLIRRDQERAASIAELQALIDEGIASGVSERTFDEVVTEARAQADAEHAS
jgi:antitoxin ParD1/3/4